MISQEGREPSTSRSPAWIHPSTRPSSLDAGGVGVGGEADHGRLPPQASLGEIHPMARDERDIEILRRMAPDRKLAVMRSLIRQAYALKEAGIRALHPDLADDEIRARTLAAVAGDRP